MGKRLMILGGSYAQVNTIEKAESMGIKTVVVDKNPNAIGFNLASYPLNISIKDTQSVLKFAKSMKIDGIIAPEADVGLFTMGEVISEMGLKGPNKISVLAAQDKRITKLCLQHAGIKFPKTINFSEVHDCDYPLIIKPVDGVCSRGVYLVTDPSDWSEYLVSESKKYSEIGEVMVEEFIGGTVFNMDMMIQDGVVMYTMLHDEIVNNKNFGVNFFIAPSEYQNCNSVIGYRCSQAVKSLGIRDGCIAIEGVMKDDIVYIFEINPRMSGSFHIPAHELSTGIDWCGDAIRIAVGEKINGHKYIIKPHGWLMGGSNFAGVIKEISRTADLEKTERLQLLKYVGDYVGKFDGVETSTDQTIYIFYTEQSNKSKVVHRLWDFSNHMKITVEV